MQDMEQAIRERAYLLWVESGFEQGNADAHWLAAQREILGASLMEIGRVMLTEVPVSTKSKKGRMPRKKRAA